MGLELLQGGGERDALRQELERNISELDQLIGEILLASRLDAKEADLGTVELVDLVPLCAEECAHRRPAGLCGRGAAGSGRAQTAAPRRAQFA